MEWGALRDRVILKERQAPIENDATMTNAEMSRVCILAERPVVRNRNRKRVYSAGEGRLETSKGA